MNATTKAQFVLAGLKAAAEQVSLTVAVMEDANISTSMWAEIKGIELNLNAVIYVLEENENDSE